MKRTRYQAGLNDFEYCVSLQIRHPNIDPKLITEALGVTPEKATRVGEQRRRADGSLLEGNYDFSHWWVKLDVVENSCLADTLASYVEKFQPAREFLCKIVEEGGESELFVGLFASRLCDSALPYTLLRDLANLGIGLRLDYYPAERTNPELLE